MNLSWGEMNFFGKVQFSNGVSELLMNKGTTYE